MQLDDLLHGRHADADAGAGVSVGSHQELKCFEDTLCILLSEADTVVLKADNTGGGVWNLLAEDPNDGRAPLLLDWPELAVDTLRKLN